MPADGGGTGTEASLEGAVVEFVGTEDAGRGMGRAKGATAGATLLGGEPGEAGAACSWGDSVGDWAPGSTDSGWGGFTLPQGLVGASDIFGFGGGSGFVVTTAGCGAGIVLLGVLEGATFARGSPSCTNQQSLPKLQWPLRYRSHGRVPIRSGLLFFPKCASSPCWAAPFPPGFGGAPPPAPPAPLGRLELPFIAAVGTIGTIGVGTGLGSIGAAACARVVVLVVGVVTGGLLRDCLVIVSTRNS